MDNHEISNENWERNVTTWDHLFGLTIKVIWHESLMSSTSIHCYRYVWICVCHCKACSLPRERGGLHFIYIPWPLPLFGFKLRWQKGPLSSIYHITPQPQFHSHWSWKPIEEHYPSPYQLGRINLTIFL